MSFLLTGAGLAAAQAIKIAPTIANSNDFIFFMCLTHYMPLLLY